MNHKYLHAINVWTKELERLSRENFFSHENQCFKLQCIFNFVSSIANLKSQGLLRLTLSRPQNFTVLREKDEGGCCPLGNASLRTQKKLVARAVVAGVCCARTGEAPCTHLTPIFALPRGVNPLHTFPT